MARARNIKPAFFKNYELADAGMVCQLLFAGLWCLADKEGRLEDKPRLIKAEIFPYYDVDINRELTVLARLKFISRYQVGEISIIEINNFKKHQNPHHTEKSSTLPAKIILPEKTSANPHEIKTCDIHGYLTVSSPSNNGEYLADSLIPDSLIPDSLIPDSLIQEKNTCEQKFNFEKELIELGVDKLVLRDWLKVRKNKKTSNTQTALKNFLVEVEKTGLSVSDAVVLCAGRSWAGLKADWILKDKDNHRPSPTKNSFDNSIAALGFHGKATALAAEELQKRYDLADVGAI